MFSTPQRKFNMEFIDEYQKTEHFVDVFALGTKVSLYTSAALTHTFEFIIIGSTCTDKTVVTTRRR